MADTLVDSVCLIITPKQTETSEFDFLNEQKKKKLKKNKGLFTV